MADERRLNGTPGPMPHAHRLPVETRNGGELTVPDAATHGPKTVVPCNWREVVVSNWRGPLKTKARRWIS